VSRARPYPVGTSNLDRKLLKAFGRGKMASDNWELRSANPHQPSSAPYAAWDCGWCEGEDVYHPRLDGSPP
jgi:hypothetical protein